MNDIQQLLAKLGGFLLAVFALGLMSGHAADSSTASSSWQLVPPEKRVHDLPELPPLAAAEKRDDSGKTWCVEGTLDGSMAAARSDFKVSFERQGWQLDKVIPLGKGTQILLLWRRGDRSIILMLREAEIGQTYFAVGLNDNSGDAPAAAPGLPRDSAQSMAGQKDNLKK